MQILGLTLRRFSLDEYIAILLLFPVCKIEVTHKQALSPGAHHGGRSWTLGGSAQQPSHRAHQPPRTLQSVAPQHTRGLHREIWAVQEEQITIAKLCKINVSMITKSQKGYQYLDCIVL